MTKLYKVFHLAGLTAAAAIVIAATQDLSAGQINTTCQLPSLIMKSDCR
jgi:hypothetical protein